jgi:flagellar assembly protein FliH
MSLSKYFKNSKSFKPEEIVKQDSSQKPGWKPLPQKKAQPFQAENEQGKTTPSAGGFRPSKIQQSSPQTPHAQQSRHNDTNPGTVPGGQEVSLEHNAVDLSQYMEQSEAQLQIDQAYLRGIEEGKTKLTDDYYLATKALVSICGQLDTVRETIINNSSKELQEFALAIVERILRVTVTEQDNTIVATIEEALQRAVRSDEFTIYLNPEDLEAVKKRSEEIINGVTGLNNIVLKQDITVERGGARLESENCLIDATITSQFEVIREEIQKRL